MITKGKKMIISAFRPYCHHSGLVVVEVENSEYLKLVKDFKKVTHDLLGAHFHSP